jgi:site-specific DNA-methyltransferase (adenine-specific)
MSFIKNDSIDLIVTSPPYNVGVNYSSNTDTLSYKQYLQFSEQWIKNCFFWSKNTGRLCINVPLDQNKYGKNSVGADITQIAKKIGWKYQSTIVWDEQNISRRTAWGSWLSASAPYVIAPVELIIVFYKEAWKKAHRGVSDIKKSEFIAWTNGVWHFNGENPKKVGHPAPFPRELPKRCIKLFSYVNDVILDPFCGSGTTIIEAITHQRFAYGLEIDKHYIAVAKKRIQAVIHKGKLING